MPKQIVLLSLSVLLNLHRSHKHPMAMVATSLDRPQISSMDLLVEWNVN